jgi:DNA-binding transcriptional LysR family regulator
MAQPPLTRQIKLLEERLECRLFERNSRSTRLTEAGAQLLERARGVVAEADRAVDAARRLGRGEEGQLTLATAPSLMLGPLPRMIRTFRAKYPRVEFRLSEMASSVILESVRSGVSDLGLIRGTDRDAEIQTHLRWKEAMVAILPPSHAAAAEASIPAGRLRGEQFVFFPRHLGPSFYDEVIGHCRRSGYTPQVAQEARQWSSILSLVSAGMGVSIGPAPVAALMQKAVRCVPLQGFETTARLVGRAAASNPSAERFVAIARHERYN